MTSLYVYHCFDFILSYLLDVGEDMLPVMNSSDPPVAPSRSWFSNQLQDVQGFIAMAMLTQDVIEDHTNLAIFIMIHHSNNQDSINLTLTSSSFLDFHIISTSKPTSSASCFLDLAVFAKRPDDKASRGQVRYHSRQLGKELRRWCLSCLQRKLDSSLGIIHFPTTILGVTDGQSVGCRRVFWHMIA